MLTRPPRRPHRPARAVARRRGRLTLHKCAAGRPTAMATRPIRNISAEVVGSLRLDVCLTNDAAVIIILFAKKRTEICAARPDRIESLDN